MLKWFDRAAGLRLQHLAIKKIPNQNSRMKSLHKTLRILVKIPVIALMTLPRIQMRIRADNCCLYSYFFFLFLSSL